MLFLYLLFLYLLTNWRMLLFNTTFRHIFNYQSLFLRWSYLSIKPFKSIRPIRSFSPIPSFSRTKFNLCGCFWNINHCKFLLFWCWRSSFWDTRIPLCLLYLLRVMRVWSYANISLSYLNPSILLCLFIIFNLNANKFICYISIKMKLLIYLI